MHASLEDVPALEDAVVAQTLHVPRNALAISPGRRRPPPGAGSFVPRDRDAVCPASGAGVGHPQDCPHGRRGAREAARPLPGRRCGRPRRRCNIAPDEGMEGPSVRRSHGCADGRRRAGARSGGGAGRRGDRHHAAQLQRDRRLPRPLPHRRPAAAVHARHGGGGRGGACGAAAPRRWVGRRVLATATGAFGAHAEQVLADADMVFDAPAVARRRRRRGLLLPVPRRLVGGGRARSAAGRADVARARGGRWGGVRRGAGRRRARRAGRRRREHRGEA